MRIWGKSIHPRRGQRLRLLGPLVAIAVVGIPSGVAGAEPRLDVSFGDEGLASASVLDGSDAVRIAEFRKGYVAIGHKRVPDRPRCSSIYSVLFKGSGELRLDYGSSGISRMDVNCGGPSSIETDPSGERFLIGTSSREPCVTGAPVRTNGVRTTWTLDTARKGHRFCIGPSNRITDISVDDRGRSLFAGTGKVGDRGSLGVVYRLSKDGSLDRSFGTRGLVEFHPRKRGRNFNTIESVKAMGSGKVLVSGIRRNEPMVARMNNDGSLDRSFGTGGFSSLNAGGGPNCACVEVDSMIRDFTGHILVLGTKRTRNGVGELVEPRPLLFRLSADGKPDAGFGTRGRLFPDLGNRDWKGTAMAAQYDGKIVASGALANGDHTTGFTLLRVTERGVLDREFFERGVFSGPEELGSRANDVLVDQAGRIVAAGGTANSENGHPTLVRILPD